MMKLATAVLACVIAALPGAGCSTMWVTADYDLTVDFGGLKTYDWLPDLKKPTLSDLSLEKEIHAAVQESVDAVLSPKGYVRCSEPRPDFYVGYHVAIEKRLAIQGMGVPARDSDGKTWVRYEPRGGQPGDDQWGARPSQQPSPSNVREYEEGSLVLDFADGRTMQLIWCGSAQAEVNRSLSTEKRRSRIDKAVRRLLALFPPT